MSSDFPHAMHVDHIRRALWKPQSRAVVMVGAGFSRNADAISSAAPPFPLWWQFTDRLRKALYPTTKPEDTPDVLRMAEEYELATGRTALDDLLLEMIPDAQHQPGPLHELLLSLPWADLFTTNYDTLLERARTKVHEYKYDLVQTPSDVARAERPRIVKLHGSFPSHRPFIFTAEDYRTYPTRFAPYVNMVQQAIMENVFCMIGFSGSDPNFLQWTGWVRDHLGSSAPKIYLCDVLDLTPAKERLYQSMRVIPVDLGPLVPASRWTTAMRYRKSLEWLLLSLHNGRPLDMSSWPARPKHATPSSRAYTAPPALLEPPAIPQLVAGPETPVQTDNLSMEALRRHVQNWRSERLLYPGWVVIPEPNRLRLQLEIGHWLDNPRDQRILPLLKSQPIAERAETLYEFLWRFRRALVPLTQWLAQALHEFLEGVNPKPDLIDLQSLTTRPEIPQGNSDRLTELWVEFAFALINNAWQDRLEDQHVLWLKRLEQVVCLQSAWKARWYHAQCWHYLLRLDEQAVRGVLRKWPENWGLPFWEAKRASVLAELGDAQAALSHAEIALDHVRQGISNVSVNHTILSEEGWIIGLIQTIESATSRHGIEPRQGFQTRINHLRSLRCSPEEDLSYRERELQQKGVEKTKSNTHGFDPGSVSTTHHFSLRASLEHWILIQMFHDGAWPLRCGNIVPALKGMPQAVRRFWEHQPPLAISIGLLSGSAEALKQMLGRVDVSAMDPSMARSIFTWLSGVFLAALEASPVIPQDGESVEGLRARLLHSCPLILSRMTIHLTPDQLEHALTISIKMYRHEACQRNSLTHALISQMFQRTLFAASVDQRYAWLPRLLELPLKGELSFVGNESPDWPEPLLFIPWNTDWRLPIEHERTSWAGGVVHLLRRMKENAPEVRANAALRLARLSKLGGLTDKQGRSFVGALWEQTDGGGFPSHTGFVPSFLVALPFERTPGDNRIAVARYLLALDVANSQHYFSEIDNATACPWHNSEERKAGVEWASNEAESLLSKIQEWWPKQAPLLKASHQKKNFFHQPSILDRLVRHLGVALIPYLRNCAETQKQAVLNLVAEIEDLGQQTLLAQPALLIFDVNRAEDTAQRIQRALHGATDLDVSRGHSALTIWFGLSQSRGIPLPPPYLLDGWIEGVVSRRQPGLLDAVHHLAAFTSRFGELLQEHHLQNLNEGLEFLLLETRPTKVNDTEDEIPLTTEQRIVLRGHASHLAARLSAEQQRRGSAIPPVLEEWRKVGSTDALPEVRRAWAQVAKPIPG
ncbi:SIR2 family protein [Corallococcus exiguus]|uniref:SIR2 family NAD-dependent protein deacylase n=1 Tax=Corallococcus exiguus TaxID=83462 RepID=UPI00147136F4|nr:SIR2 family protein [Corallococcus exiguus]NNB99684.1 SIR2 family protein [Corallococcus exiguus]NNC08607.1 SIR2 family protein [Corallococcus exiguus]